jgi:hypothetical protein
MNRADSLLLIIVLSGLPFLYINTWGTAGQIENLEIWSAPQGKTVESVDTDKFITVKGSQGDSIIEIHDHKARFLKSPCKNKVCIRSGWLEHNGAFAACLPNRVSMQLTGFDKKYDSINF